MVAGAAGGARRGRAGLAARGWPAAVPGTPHRGAGRRRDWRSSSASRSSSRWGPTSACSRSPASRSRCSATAVRRCSSTWPRSGWCSAVRRDGGTRRLWACRPGATRGRGWSGYRVRRSRPLLVSFGVTPGGCRAAGGEAAARRGAAPDDAVLPAARAPRRDHRPARRRSRERRGRRRRADRVLVVPALLHRRPADIDRLAALTGRPADAVLRRQIARHRASLVPAVADVPPAGRRRGRRRRHRPVCWWCRARAGAIRRARCSARCSASTGVATPADDAALARAARWARSSAVPGWSRQYDPMLRGTDGRQCVYVDPRACPAALGAYGGPAVRGADLRLSLDLGLQRELDAGPRRGCCAAQPPAPRDKVGAAVAMDPRSGRCSRSPARRRTTTTSTGRRSTPARWPRLRRARSTDARARHPGRRARPGRRSSSSSPRRTRCTG